MKESVRCLALMLAARVMNLGVPNLVPHLLLSCVLCATATAETAPRILQSSAAIRAHTRFLADDLLEGRATGLRGEALAAAYIASQLEALGLAPGGNDGTYFQAVPLIQARARDAGSFVISGKSGKQELLFGEDYLPAASHTTREQRIHAPVAFVGFGIVAPERGIDSYAGIDVRNKIVLALSGAPNDFPSEERAYYSSTRLKKQEATNHGAAGLVILRTPMSERVYPFEHDARNWDKTGSAWTDASGAPAPFARGAPMLATVSLSGGRKLLADAPVSFDEVMSAAELKGGTLRSFTLPLTATIEANSTISRISGSNVIGILPGTDPQLKNQYVVLTAHYDHLAMKASASGEDAIYNGALDNAAGVAVLLEVARMLSDDSQRRRRSILFTFVSAEEQGLVGSDYFAHHPTVPRASLIADINIDMPLLTYDFIDIVAFGASHSSLGPIVRQAAERLGVESSPDPVPEQAVFIRSDHFSFVRQGIPSVMIATGFSGPGRAAYEDFLKHRYHQPNDDLTQPLHYAAGAKLAALVADIVTTIANQDEQPTWNPGDFFGTKMQQ